MNDLSPQIDDITLCDCDAKSATLCERHNRSVRLSGGCLRTVVKNASLGGIATAYQLVYQVSLWSVVSPMVIWIGVLKLYCNDWDWLVQLVYIGADITDTSQCNNATRSDVSNPSLKFIYIYFFLLTLVGMGRDCSRCVFTIDRKSCNIMKMSYIL